MDILAVTNQILMMLLIMGVGLLLRKAGVITAQVIHGISGIVLKVAMPSLVLMMVQKDGGQALKGEFMRIALICFLWMSAGLVIVFFLFKNKMAADRGAAFAGLSALPNVGYMGLPIIQAVYGDLGAVYLAAAVVGLNCTIYLTLEILMTGRLPKLSSLAGNIGLILSLLALVSFMMDLRLPMPFSALVSQLGGLTTPLSMLLAGARLMDFRLPALKDKELWLAIFVRLLALPMAGFALFRLLDFEGLPLGVITLACAMPGAVATQMYAEREKKDALFAATGVSLGTILCLASIPLVLLITGLGK